MPRTQTTRRSSKPFRSVALFVAGLAIAGALFEASLRVIGATPLWRVLPQPEAALYGPDIDTGYRHRAGASGIWLTENRAKIVISTLGLRDRERALAKPEGVSRAVVLGDSIIEALQVDLEQTTAFVAERELAKRGRTIEVANLGLAGAGAAVKAARLRGLAPALGADVAIVLAPTSDFDGVYLRNEPDYPSYRRAGSGVELSYQFRENAGYRFRISSPGRAIYWALDNSQLARVLNARKNAGVLAEFIRLFAAPPPPLSSDTPVCPTADIAKLLALWRDGQPADSDALLGAFLRDLEWVVRERKIAVTLALRGIGEPCTAAAALRAELVAAIETRVARHGVTIIDLDRLIFEALGSRPKASQRLHGFRAPLGGGHLNAEGNAVYGRIFADAIAQALSATSR